MDWLDLVPMFRALGDPNRARIFEFLCGKDAPLALEDSGEVHPVRGCTIGEVCCHVTGQDQFSSTVSFHLKELRLAGLIRTEKQGRFTICTVNRVALAALREGILRLESQSSAETCP